MKIRTALATVLLLVTVSAAEAQQVIFRNGFESGDTSTWSSPWEAIAPDAILEEWATLDAEISRIDEHPLFADGVKITGFADGSYIRVSFPTPAAAPGAGTQQFLFWINSSSSQPDEYVPLVSARLYEAGVERADLGSQPVTSATGQILAFTWSVENLSISDGSEVELLITFIHQAHFIAVPLLDAIAWESPQ